MSEPEKQTNDIEVVLQKAMEQLEAMPIDRSIKLRLVRSFEMFDADYSCTLCKDEAFAAMLSFLPDAAPQELQQLIVKADADANGCLDVAEFARLALPFIEKQAALTLPQYAAVRRLLELFTENRSDTWTDQYAVTEWNGVRCDYSTGDVIGIVLRLGGLGGQLNWDALTELPHLRVADFYNHGLSGIFSTTVKFRALPLVEIDLHRYNQPEGSDTGLTGDFDFAHMPATMVYVDIAHNSFTIKNWAAVAQLAVLNRLHMSDSDLSSAGPVDFALLPSSLDQLQIDRCTFAVGAAADIAALPAAVTCFLARGTKNLTLFCSDIAKVAALPLDSNTRACGAEMQIVVGSVSDAAAPRETLERVMALARLRVEAVSMCKAYKSVTRFLPPSWTEATPLDKWVGVEVNEGGFVVKIVAENTKMEGQIDLDALLELRDLQVLNLDGHMLSGACAILSKLAQSQLRELNLGRYDVGAASLTGDFDFQFLPSSLELLNLNYNSFTIKTWRYARYCSCMTSLQIACNDLSGDEVDLGWSPAALTTLNVSKCTFAPNTCVNLADLPTGISSLSLEGCKNLTLHCAKPAAFALLPLNDASKKEFSKQQRIVLGDIGDESAPRVSGIELFEMVRKREHATMCSVVKGVKQNRPPSWTEASDLPSWAGVELNHVGLVVKIVAQNTKMEGQIDLAALAELSQLKVLNLDGHMLSGPCATTLALYNFGLETLNLNRCEPGGLTGDFDCEHLPRTLVTLSLKNNSFSVKKFMGLSNLGVLRVLNLSGNDLSTVSESSILDVAYVSRELVELVLDNCVFAPETVADLSELPAGLTTLSLAGTKDLTLCCRAPNDFGTRPLSDESKKGLKDVQVALGYAWDVSTAERVTGEKLLTMVAVSASEEYD